MSPSHSKIIVGVWDGPGGQYRCLLDALSRLYPVEFRHTEPTTLAGLDAFVALGDDPAPGLAAAAAGIPSFAVAGNHVPAQHSTAGVEVRFGTSASLDSSLCNQVMTDLSAGVFPPLAPQAGDEILGSAGEQPVWLERPAGKATCQLVSAPPPAVARDEFLFPHLTGVRFLRLLPLMNFLCRQVRDVNWQDPTRRACFVFDDPSLYWPSYGFLDFRLLARHVLQNQCCVSIATIPLDVWWVNRSVADTLRSCGPRLTVLIHGNNHIFHEMRSPDGGLAAAAQGLRRMERLRSKHGLAVCNVMVAPHGAIAAEMFPPLLRLGYDAALITTELLVRYNAHTAWPAILGLERTALLGGGLPVVPRIRMSRWWKSDAILAAFLRQPIVIAGHHQDARNKLQTLEEITASLNGPLRVTWSDMQTILRSNYLEKREGDLLRIRMFSRAVTVLVPQGVRRICVERAWIEPERTEQLVLRPDPGDASTHHAGPVSQPHPLENGVQSVEVASRLADPIDCAAVPAPGLYPWPIARKILMEVRDRLTPTFPLASRQQRWINNE